MLSHPSSPFQDFLFAVTKTVGISIQAQWQLSGPQQIQEANSLHTPSPHPYISCILYLNLD